MLRSSDCGKGEHYSLKASSNCTLQGGKVSYPCPFPITLKGSRGWIQWLFPTSKVEVISTSLKCFSCNYYSFKEQSRTTIPPRWFGNKQMINTIKYVTDNHYDTAFETSRQYHTLLVQPVELASECSVKSSAALNKRQEKSMLLKWLRIQIPKKGTLVHILHSEIMTSETILITWMKSLCDKHNRSATTGIHCRLP